MGSPKVDVGGPQPALFFFTKTAVTQPCVQVQECTTQQSTLRTSHARICVQVQENDLPMQYAASCAQTGVTSPTPPHPTRAQRNSLIFERLMQEYVYKCKRTIFQCPCSKVCADKNVTSPTTTHPHTCTTQHDANVQKVCILWEGNTSAS